MNWNLLIDCAVSAGLLFCAATLVYALAQSRKGKQPWN
jgi:hypothetical protein